MSLARVVGFVSMAAVGGVTIGGMGCSSSTKAGGGNPTTVDSGTIHTDSGTTVHDGGTVSDSTTTSGDSSMSSGDSGDGGTCTPASTSSYTAPTYVAAVAHQGVCTAAQITAFVTACGDNSSQSGCTTWINANVAADASAGDPCGNCIIAPMNNGATWVDPEGYFGPNYAGCIQLGDPTHGTACATAFNNEGGCEGVACDSCSDTSYESCVTTVDTGSCATYVSATKSSCTTDFADGGVLDTCSPGAASGAENPDFTYIATLICGGAATDGGAADQ